MHDYKPEVVQLDPATLTPYAKNSKKHPDDQLDKIAGQIHRFGFDQPIVVDENKIIIKGHGRREAALRLGLPTVPVIVRSDLNDHEKLAARIGDNKVAESDWDNDALKFEFGTLRRAEFDLDLTGFDESERRLIESTWESDIELDKGDSHTDGLTGKITVTCPADMRAELKDFIKQRVDEQGFEGVEFN